MRIGGEIAPPLEAFSIIRPPARTAGHWWQLAGSAGGFMAV